MGVIRRVWVRQTRRGSTVPSVDTPDQPSPSASTGLAVDAVHGGASRFLRTEDPDVARTLVICLQKGGTGKTTFAAEVGHEMARLGAKVLLIDFDPNWALTRSLFGFDPADGDPVLTITDVISPSDERGRPAAVRAGAAAEAILHVPEAWQVRHDVSWEHGGALIPGGALAFIPGYPTLQGVIDSNLQAVERRLSKALQGVARQFDIVIIDTGPRADKSVQSAMLAASTCISPSQPEPGSTESITEQLEFLETVHEAWDHPIRFAGAICTQFDSRAKRAHGEGLDEMRNTMRKWKPSAPAVTAPEFLSGEEPWAFRGEVGATVWDEILPRTTTIIHSAGKRRPLASGLLPGAKATFHQRKEAERVFKQVKHYSRVGLRLLQLMDAPCLVHSNEVDENGRPVLDAQGERLPGIAAALIANPIPGVWPPAEDEASDDGSATTESAEASMSSGSRGLSENEDIEV